MVMAISHKEGARINVNTFELVIESLLLEDKWKESLLLLKTMEKVRASGWVGGCPLCLRTSHTFTHVFDSFYFFSSRNICRSANFPICPSPNPQMQFQPSLETYVALVERLEKAREYKAVLALYRAMVGQGYDFYENSVLNGVFKRLVNVVGKGVDLEKVVGQKTADMPVSVDVFSVK